MDAASVILAIIAIAVTAYLVTVVHTATARMLARAGDGDHAETRLLAWPRWLWGLILGLAALWALYTVRGILTPFVLGAVIAYALNPVIERMRTRGMERDRAISLVFLVFLVLIVLAAVVILPAVASQGTALVASYDSYVDQVHTLIVEAETFVVERGGQFGVVPEEVHRAFSSLADYGQGYGLTLLKSVLGWLNQSLSLAMLLIITPVVAFWLLRDYHSLPGLFLRPLTPAHRQATVQIASDVNKVVGSYLLGLALMMIVIALFATTALSVLGVRFAVLLGVMTGLLYSIPYIGYPTSMAVVALTMAMDHRSVGSIVLVIAVLVAGNLIADYGLYPRLVGRRVGLHPLVVIFAVLAGGVLFNFLGILLAVPVAGVVKVLMQRFWPEGFVANAPPPAICEPPAAAAEPTPAPPDAAQP